MSDEAQLSLPDPGPAGFDFREAHAALDGWRSDWDNAPRGEVPFLVLLPDGNVTTAAFFWYTESDHESTMKPIAMWALQDVVRDEPLDDCTPVHESRLRWRLMPSGPWSEQPTNFDLVGAFNKKFGLPVAGEGEIQFLDDHTFRFRSDFILEEHTELGEGHRERDMVKVADALGDLLYVVYGMAHFYGIPLDRVFRAIHAKNMTKVRATDPSASKRGTALDVVKPVGFVGPEEDIRAVLEEAGYVDADS